MPFSVSAFIDDDLVSVKTETRKQAFGKAVEWHVVRKLTDVSISDGRESYSIAEFASMIANENCRDRAEGDAETTGPRPARRWTSDEDRELQVLLDAGRIVREIALKLCRTPQGVYARLQRLYRKQRRLAETSRE